MHPWTQHPIKIVGGAVRPNVLGLTVVAHDIAESLVSRAMVDGSIEPDVGLALSAVASIFLYLPT